MSDGEVETAQAIDFFQKKAARRVTGIKLIPEPKFEFKVYGRAKSALRKLFHEKCGYCEIGYGGATREVEHYRPLKRIDYLVRGAKTSYQEGYYWLGADWENLILSCSHCNKLETHEHQNQAHAVSCRKVSGKGNFFTLENEATRAQPTNCVKSELPLLLNPCRDNPDEHLYFRIDGIVVPKVIDGKGSDRGKESIITYGLRRRELVDLRKDTARMLSLAIDRLNIQVALLKENPLNNVARMEILATLFSIRENFLRLEKPFLALSRTIFRESVDLKEIKSLLT